MKRFISIILTMLIVSITVLPVCAAEAVKGTEANPYTFKEIPSTWIKTVKKDNVVTGYTITVANGKKATLKLSGTQFKEYSKGKDGKFGKPIEFTKGKLKTIKNVSVIKVVLRDKAEKKSTSGVPEVNVSSYYQSGMSWSEVRASLNKLVGPAYSIAESGNLTQDDGVSPTNINVISSGNSYKIYITGWRRDKNSDAATSAILKKTQSIFAFFFGNSAGTALFNMKDDIATGNFTSASDYGFVDKESGTASGTLTYTNGTRIYYESDGTYTAFYVG